MISPQIPQILVANQRAWARRADHQHKCKTVTLYTGQFDFDGMEIIEIRRCEGLP